MTSNDDQICIPMSQRNTDGLPGMTSSDLQTSTEGAVLSFHHIYYRVKVKSGFLPGQNKEELEILSDINGIMKPGLNAILGPTGGGKSFLLDILAARKDPRGLSGEVLVNGAPQNANFPCESGYVAQDGVGMGTLTVRENLQFAAALRLPTTMTNHEKNERINKLIQDLGLSKVADVKFISGGERKRISIAMELIMDPPILFLDEPTTGLDSSTASTVLLLLKRISEQGRTIIFSIHQPQYSIFKLFDCLTLLASGRLIFHGPAQEALGYFESIGYLCEPYNNPADFFLDIINEDSSAVGLNREEGDWEANETEQLSQREKSVVEKLVEYYATSSFYRDTKAELDELSRGQEKKRSSAFKNITYVTSFCHQLQWIIRRSFKNVLGIPRASIVGAICSVLAGQIFVVERKLFIHEYISGYYRLPCYFFGKLLFDLLPRKLLPSMLFICIIYLMAGLKPEAGAFFITIITVMMVTYTASSLSLAMATGQNLHYLSTLLMNFYFVFMMVFLVISLYVGTIPPKLSWLQYLSIPHYGFRALQHTQFLGQNFCLELGTIGSNTCSNYVICTGEEFLIVQGMDLSPWGLWQNLLGLVVLMIFFLIITYFRLLFLRKYS
uniref:Broad substrate specificity ATP-binding cassette transporter ABCG2 n=1 Tax=Spermophilus dauricus TaxID=99837 RepID=A0A8C9QKC8_SPEDA